MTHNLVQLDHKHVGIDRHFIKEKLDSRIILHFLCHFLKLLGRHANQRTGGLYISSNPRQAENA